jgi:hypothetical protein
MFRSWSVSHRHSTSDDVPMGGGTPQRKIEKRHSRRAPVLHPVQKIKPASGHVVCDFFILRLARDSVKLPLLFTSLHCLQRSLRFNFIHFYSSIAAFFQPILSGCHVIVIHGRMRRCCEVLLVICVVYSSHFNDAVAMCRLSSHFYVFTKANKNGMLAKKCAKNIHEDLNI